MNSKMKHIDDVQPATVEEHLKILKKANDEGAVIAEIFKDVTFSDFPEWFDEELFKAGQRYYADNLLGMTAASLAGLISVLSIPSILDVLVYTKKSSTPCTAYRRYLETIYHARAWYLANFEEPNSDWWKSLNTVRWKHCNVSRNARKDGLCGITHRDMALTQFGFIGYVLIEPEKLGLTNSPKEREGIIHVWRVLGHVLGISDRFNICRKTEAETVELCRRLRSEIFVEYFEKLPPNFVEMTESMLDGLWTVDMAVDKDAFFAFAFKLNRVPYYKPLSLYSQLNLIWRENLHKICGVPVIGTVVRVWYNYFLNFNFWLMKRWPVMGWLRFGKTQSTLNLYPKLK